MKTVKTLLIVTFLAFITLSQAQKKISISDVYQGQTILEIAKQHAVNAYTETRAIYKDGMTEAQFITECLKAFPKEYYSLRDVYVPYAKYLYSFHKKGLTVDQVSKLVTGQEYVNCANGILAWREANPGLEPTDTPWWRWAIHWAAVILTKFDEILPM